MNKVFAIDTDEELRRAIKDAGPGEYVELTVDGQVVATARIREPFDPEKAKAAMERIFEIGNGISFDGIPIKELTHGGHRY